jgi:3-hydroxy-9,10-secoandrosta-1,3,5(10)-triene-9,17-dione monooxygenase
MTATDTDELLERAAALRPVLERNAAKGEEDRRIADESIEALVEAGLRSTARRCWGVENDVTDLV